MKIGFTISLLGVFLSGCTTYLGPSPVEVAEKNAALDRQDRIRSQQKEETEDNKQELISLIQLGKTETEINQHFRPSMVLASDSTGYVRRYWVSDTPMLLLFNQKKILTKFIVDETEQARVQRDEQASRDRDQGEQEIADQREAARKIQRRQAISEIFSGFGNKQNQAHCASYQTGNIVQTDCH